MHPAPTLVGLLIEAYGPCKGFADSCRTATWNPAAGHAPRGFCGAAGELGEVRLVLVCAEPGDPHPSECHETGDSAAERFNSVSSYAWSCFSAGKDQFHRNVRSLLDLCWPGLTFDEQMRKTWITDSVLCSAARECGPVPREMEKGCATRFLIPQLSKFPRATIVALGRKAEGRLIRAGVRNFESAYSVAPPGCNQAAARLSWERVAEVVRARTAQG